VDQAIAGRQAKQEALDKRRSLRITSGNLLDIHRALGPVLFSRLYK
jgi:hypothetical protein